MVLPAGKAWGGTGKLGGLDKGPKESDKVGDVLKKPLWEPGEEGRRGWDLGSQVFDSRVCAFQGQAWGGHLLVMPFYT